MRAHFHIRGAYAKLAVLSPLVLSSIFFALVNGVVIAQETPVQTVVIEIKGTIGVPTLDYIQEGLSYARDVNAQSITILLDTPGGSLDATFEIVKVIERSEIPIITFVYPSGATGWSAGVFIILSSHVAAMSSGTVMGSSQPHEFPSGTPITDPKLINALTEFIAERARIHGRNETLATRFITENLNLGADDAKKLGVIDAQAESVDELMNLLEGREIEIFERGSIRLQTKGTELIHLDPSIRVRILNFISEPTFAYLLLNVGFLILFLGLMTVGPEVEVIGGIILLIGLIGLGYSVDLFVIILLLVGGILIIAEMMQPGLQIFGPAGIVAFILGSLLLLRLDPTRWLISQEWYTLFLVAIATMMIILTGFGIFILYKIFRLPKQRIAIDSVIGKVGIAVDSLGPEKEGSIQVEGEYWKARASEQVMVGQAIIVKAKVGPVLIVEPQTKSLSESSKARS
ncbi:MAG: hypothetical protein QG670_3 [Thermoproteota archaeon]|nr:hypothetical protein [Thermoproteota archaeon]